jgi:hypothetical protein
LTFATPRVLIRLTVWENWAISSFSHPLLFDLKGQYGCGPVGVYGLTAAVQLYVAKRT